MFGPFIVDIPTDEFPNLGLDLEVTDPAAAMIKKVKPGGAVQLGAC